MKDLLEFILKEVVGKENFTIEEDDQQDKTTLTVKVEADDMGLIIGKGGRTIKAIQDILRVRGNLEKKSVFVNISERTQD